jgi:two-component system cell cycle sensor histidine kinase/response regulator CckA
VSLPEGKGPTASVVAHEFNNLLMGIQTYLEIIRKQSPGNEVVARAADEIGHAIRRGKNMSAQILRHPVAVEPVKRQIDFAELIRKLVPDLKTLVGSNVLLQSDIPSEVINLDADPLLLHHAVANVALDAIEWMPRGGRLKFGLTNHDGEAQLLVESTAIGGPEILGSSAQRDRVQDSYLGLGLSMADQIARKHGGTLNVRRTDGNARVVSMTLPSHRTVDAPETRSAGRELSKLVLVEDDPIVSSGIAAVLELEGIEVVRVDRGEQALSAIELSQPDAVILDVDLPDASGVEIYRQIAERWPGLSVLFSSGRAEQSSLDPYLKQPHVGFLLKPYEMKTLVETLSRLIRSR